MHHAARAALSALVVACALAAPSVAAASDTYRVPTQGMYEFCDPSRSQDGCASRLQRIGQAGFRVVVNSWIFLNPSEQRLRAYAQAAVNAGVQVIWSFHGTGFQEADPNGNGLLKRYPDLASRCACTTNQGLLAYLMGILRGLPSTWGYYLVDEPSPDKHDALVGWVSRIKELDPDRPRVIMGCGICAGGPLANIAWMADLDVSLGTDAYPVFGGPPNPAAAYASVQQNVSTFDQIATGAGRRQVVALQSWRWGDSAVDAKAAGVDAASTRFPTQEEIEAQRNAAIENAHPDLILWFTLTQVIGWEPGQTVSNWWDPTDTAQRWSNLLGGAFAPPPVRAPSTPGAAGQPTAVAASAPARTLQSKRTVLARFMIRRGPRSKLGRRFIADAGRSRAPGGRIVRYEWRLNGKRLAGLRSRRRVFHVRRSGVQRLKLTVTSNRGARAVAQRKFSVRS